MTENQFKLRLDKAVENIKELGFDEFFDEIEDGIYQCKFIGALQIRESGGDLHIIIPKYRKTVQVEPTEDDWFNAIKGEPEVPTYVKENVADEFYDFDEEKIPDTVFADECDEFTVDDILNYFPVDYSFEFEDENYLHIYNPDLVAGSTEYELLWEAFDGLQIKEGESVHFFVLAECKPLDDVRLAIQKDSPVVFMDKATEQCRVDTIKAPIHIGKLLKANNAFTGEVVLTTTTDKGYDIKMSDRKFSEIIYPHTNSLTFI